MYGYFTSYTERNRKEKPPEKLFDGIQLKVTQAIFNGDTKEIEHYMAGDKVDPNTIDPKGEITFLSYAIMMEDLSVMQKLLELGADPEFVSPTYWRFGCVP